jgi:hypothetical protein
MFTCRVRPDGDPRPPRGWEKSPVDSSVAESWKAGTALCGVTGIVYDVIDVDPRNGGKASWERLVDDLGDDGPEVYWTVYTPSGGTHFYIAPLGIGSRPGFLPGIDLKGGMEDGESRGFVFLPPTSRPSKVDGVMRAYTFRRGPLPVADGDGGCEALRIAITEYENEKRAAASLGDSGPRMGRRATADLRTACIEAPPGGQRAALLSYTHELERMGYERADILVLLENVASLMPVYDPRHPWVAKDLRKLLHREGSVVGDALPGEMEGIDRIVPKSSLVKSFEDVEDEMVSWLWPGYIAFGEMTVLDGEKGTAKSLVTVDIIARLTTGRPMPGQDAATCEPGNVIIFTEESSRSRELKKRLRVAGADLRRVKWVDYKKDKRGKAAGLVLPDSESIFRRAIAEADAVVAVWDPITDFLAEDIQTHNDASVRRALRPLGTILAEAGCAGWLIRHMNKDSGARAKFRGAGTTAFQNRARVHLVTGHLPGGADGRGKYGIAIVDSNLMAREEGVLAYDIVDSDEIMDNVGSKVGMISWAGMVSVSVDEMTAGGGAKRGPRGIEQEAIREVLEALFAAGDTWPQRKVMDELKAAGCSTNATTLGKVKKDMGVRSVPRGNDDGSRGVSEWMWTVLPPERESARNRDSSGSGSGPGRARTGTKLARGEWTGGNAGGNAGGSGAGGRK